MMNLGETEEDYETTTNALEANSYQLTIITSIADGYAALAHLQARIKVLHVAPEQCFHKRFRSMKNLTYITADLGSPLADVKLDIQEMPFEDNEFDIIICNHVLEHVADDHKAMSEIFRVLKQGGFALLQVPIDYSAEKTYEDSTITDPKEREKHFRQRDHYRLYGKDYLKRLKEVGFNLREENYLFVLSETERERFKLPAMEFMYGYYK